MPTEEQQELRKVVREFFAKLASEAAVRALAETGTGVDREVWMRAADLGLTGLAIDPGHGGSGAGFGTLGVVLEEAGAALACSPLLSSSVLAATCLGASDDPRAESWLAAIAAGTAIATAVLPLGDDAEVLGLDAVPGEHWHVTGSSAAIDGMAADVLLVFAKTPDSPALFLVEVEAPGLGRRPARTLDITRHQAVLLFENVQAHLLVADATELLRTARDRACAAVAAELVGGAQRCLDMTVEYVKTREQFGRPIGSFQAVKHRAAEMLIRVEAARAATAHALWCADERPLDSSAAASAAKAAAGEGFAWVATETIHLHGGIGFTWEHPAHLYYRRAMSALVLFGHPDRHDRDRGRALLGRIAPTQAAQAPNSLT